jgi:two-component system, cell cycle sensor histidine kinase and response regulator CckA
MVEVQKDLNEKKLSEWIRNVYADSLKVFLKKADPQIPQLLGRMLRESGLEFSTLCLAHHYAILNLTPLVGEQTETNDLGPLADFQAATLTGWTSEAIQVNGFLTMENQIRLFEAAIEHSPEAILLTEGFPVESPGPRIMYVNRAFTQMTGFTPEDIVGKTPRVMNGPETAKETLKEVRDSLFQKRPGNFHLEQYRKGGERFWCELSILPVLDVDGRPLYYVWIPRIAKPTVEESRIRQVERMEAVSRLTAGIAQNFNNMLMIIQGYSDLMAEHLPTERLRQQNAYIGETTRRATEMLRELTVFSSVSVINPQIADLNRVITETTPLVRKILSPAYELKCSLLERPLPVLVDEGQLTEAITHLVINASDAMPGGGKIEVTTGFRQLDPSWCNKSGDDSIIFEGQFRPGNYVSVAVSDTGEGIDPQVLALIFEPFFTTKNSGDRNGLGLAAVYGFVMRSGGIIQVETGPQRGTKVTLYFISQPNFLLKAKKVDTQIPQPLKLTALVVEDEPLIREMQLACLKDLGFGVLSANDGIQGIEIADSHPGKINLVVTDEFLPGKRGRAVIEHIRRKCPSCRFLLMSGSMNGTFFSEFNKNFVFLKKPFSADDFMEAVNRLFKN